MVSPGGQDSFWPLCWSPKFPGDGLAVAPGWLLLWQNEHDENARREMAFGKRIGFYRFKSELGTGNFSKVKLATNLLTKGGD